MNGAVSRDQGGAPSAFRRASSPINASSEAAVSDHTLRSLSHPEPADLLRRLQMLTASEFDISRRRQTARRWFVRFLAVCCISLIPWTIGLGMSLPRTYVAANWRLLWTGFDVVLLVCLSVTAWGLWKQRQVVVPASIITSVLLLCDAWFDLFTANGHRQLIVSAATELFGELPSGSDAEPAQRPGSARVVTRCSRYGAERTGHIVMPYTADHVSRSSTVPMNA